jgi:hypothetical protein
MNCSLGEPGRAAYMRGLGDRLSSITRLLRTPPLNCSSAARHRVAAFEEPVHTDSMNGFSLPKRRNAAEVIIGATDSDHVIFTWAVQTF